MSNANNDQELGVDKLLGELTHGPISLSSASELSARRARLLPRLREQVKQVPASRLKAKRRRRFVATAWVASVAAVVVTVVGASQLLTDDLRPDDLRSSSEDAPLVLQPRGNAVELVDRGEYRAVSEPLSIAASGRLDTRRDAALTTANGVLVELSGQTSVGLDELNQRSGWRLQLRRGHVACEVPKLGERTTFSVVTNGAEVVVHGTRFTVATDATRTCVRVAEGRVEVRTATSATFLTPGQQWGCDGVEAEPVATAVTTPSADAVVGANKPAQIRRVTSKPSTSTIATTSSTLALETDLVGRALAAERRGEFTLAKGLYVRFLEQYPSSPMAPEARRGLRRVSQE